MGSAQSSSSAVVFPARTLVGQCDAQRGEVVVSYNVLSDVWANKEKTLLFAQRAPAVASECLSVRSSVICVQEAGSDACHILQKCLAEKAQHFEYAHVANEEGEGIGVFWDRSRWQMMHEHSIQFAQMAAAVPRNDADGVALVCYKRLAHITHHSVAQIVLLQHKHRRDVRLMVVNTHLYWGPGGPDVAYQMQIVQMLMLLQQVEKMRTDWDCASVPLVLCGDFNCEDADLISFLRTGLLSKSNSLLTIGGRMPEAKEDLRHSLGPLRSCYCQTSEPEATTMSEHFCGRIDWIFVNETAKIGAVVHVPPKSELPKTLPGDVYPSDHVMIGTELLL